MINNKLGSRLINIGFVLIIAAIISVGSIFLIPKLTHNGDAGLVLLPVFILSAIIGPAAVIIGLLINKTQSREFMIGRNLIIIGIIIAVLGYESGIYLIEGRVRYGIWVEKTGLIIIILGIASMTLAGIKKRNKQIR